MKKRFLFYFLMTFGFTSCLIADDIFKPEDEYRDPIDIVVKDSVRAYLLRNIRPDESYLNYGFGDLRVIVPWEVSEYAKWSGRKGNVNFDQKKVAGKIEELDSIIDQKNLQRTLEIDHVFSTRRKGDSLGEVNKMKFYLNEDFEVKDFDLGYHLVLTEKRERAFANFYYESPLIRGYSYDESKRLNESFYKHFKQKLDSLSTIKERENFLNHTIIICENMMQERAFDQQAIAETLVKEYLKSGSDKVSGYQPKAFSELYQINEVGSLSGYYLFHTFSFEISEGMDSMSVYIKFSPHYEIKSIFETQQEFEAKTIFD